MTARSSRDVVFRGDISQQGRGAAVGGFNLRDKLYAHPAGTPRQGQI